ncbi:MULTISPECIES: hypothetical protein [Pseudomonas]|uniref:hypothetical protein n=1 Tax=Pseudomonas TaxID=286 RepID=UPI002E267750|nr:hypothetical protein [Pseudomonas sp. JH-2]
MIRLVQTFVFVFGPAVALATPSPSQNYQDLKGDCNVVINNPQGGNVQLPTTTFCSGLAASKSAADSLQKMARFIEASNPTNVKFSNVNLTHWAGDAERYLTLSLENTSNLPAEKVKIRILDINQSSPLRFSPSHVLSKKLLDTLAVPQHSATQIPIGPESELVILTKRRVPVGYDFIGASLSPNIPEDLKSEYLNSKGISSPYLLNIEITPLGLELKYSTIFGGSNTVMAGVFLFYGRAITH